MSAPTEIHFTNNAEDQPEAVADGVTIGSLAGLLKAAPELTEAGGLGRYCEALNHFTHGEQFRMIYDPAAFREKYERRLQAEKTDEPFQDGAVRIGDFGVCDTSGIASPTANGETVIFFVEDDYLGIPYRVTGPAPGKAGREAQYEPLPTMPGDA